jgi:hypothetical protein
MRPLVRGGIQSLSKTVELYRQHNEQLGITQSKQPELLKGLPFYDGESKVCTVINTRS